MLAGIIDYAGLFPPANLPMRTAIENFANFRKHEHRWMLSRFICPAARLEELSQVGGNLFAENPAFHFSVLVGGGETVAAFQDHLAKQADAVRQFLHRHHGNVVVDVFEIRLPSSVLAGELPDLFSQLERAESSQNACQCFYEVPSMENWSQTMRMVIPAFAKENYGFKLRTGGVEPIAFPSCQKVADVVTACRDADVCWKATAGLHHPFRHKNDSVKTKMHGFLNLLFAVVLAEVHSLDETQIETIIADENPESFCFTQDEICWQDFSANIDDIQRIRKTRFAGFGSCSFDEPREDLKKLNLFA